MNATASATIPTTNAATAVKSSSMPVTRWAIAIIVIVYGFAKLNGSQFTVLDSELDKPMGMVSGFWLTWYYFGYSAVYGNLLALIQIACGLLVTRPRFALLGALILLPLTVNIVLVDIFYGVDLGGTLAALLLLALLVRIVAPHIRPLLSVVVPPRTERAGILPAFVAPLALVVVVCGFTYWVANYNNRAPTAVDGVWAVESTAAGEALERVFFERNRAFMVVLKDTVGAYHEHHFELEPDGRLRIWEDWLTKGALLYEGAYTSPDRIELRRAEEPGEGVVELRRAW